MMPEELKGTVYPLEFKLEALRRVYDGQAKAVTVSQL